jgi:hypothetical protein
VKLQSNASDSVLVGDGKNDDVALGGDVFDLTTPSSLLMNNRGGSTNR